MAAPHYQSPNYHRAARGEPCPECGRAGAGCLIFDHGGAGCMHTTNGEPFPDGAFLGARKVRWPSPSSGPRAHAPGAPPRPTPRAIAAAVAPADIATRDAVYRALLSACPLGEDDRGYLLGCGLPAGDLDGYGTLSARAGATVDVPDAVLATIPGLVRRPDGSWTPLRSSGLLLASYDVHGRIQALRVRVPLQDGDKRYLWLSGGTSSSVGTPATVRRPAGLQDRTTVWLTEGEKKAHLCALRTGCVTIGIPGIGCWAAAADALAQLRTEGCYRVIVALDEDSTPETREKVERCRQEVCDLAVRRGFAVEIARWEPEQGKGIDDLPAGYIPPAEVAIPATATAGKVEAVNRFIRELLPKAIPDRGFRVAVALAFRDGVEEAPPKQTWMPDLAAAAGITPSCKSAKSAEKAVGQTILDLAERGIVERQQKPDPDNGHKRVLAALRPSGIKALPLTLLPTARRLKDAERKRRCKHCGSTRLVLRCADCGALQDDVSPAAAADGKAIPATDAPPHRRKFRRGGPAYEQREREYEYEQLVAAEAAEETDAAAAAGGTPKATSANHINGESVSLPTPISARRIPMADSAIGPAPQSPRGEETRTTPATASGSADAAARPPSSPAAGSAQLQAARVEIAGAPCSANRPTGHCAGCGKIMWSSAGGRPWYCSNCGADAREIAMRGVTPTVSTMAQVADVGEARPRPAAS